MKKLMILFAIALMANVASAAVIDLLVNDVAWTGEDVKPSDIITVTWVNDTVGGGYGGFASLTINVSNGDNAGNAWIYYPQPMLPEIRPLEVGFDVVISAGSIPTPTGPLAGWEFHVPDSMRPGEDIIIDPVSGAFNNVYAVLGPDDELPYIVLDVIPEPATFVLLGLGGLLLARRRRA